MSEAKNSYRENFGVLNFDDVCKLSRRFHIYEESIFYACGWNAQNYIGSNDEFLNSKVNLYLYIIENKLENEFAVHIEKLDQAEEEICKLRYMKNEGEISFEVFKMKSLEIIFQNKEHLQEILNHIWDDIVEKVSSQSTSMGLEL